MNKSACSSIILGIGIAVIASALLAAWIPGLDDGFGLNKVIALATGTFLIVSSLLVRGTFNSKTLRILSIFFFSYLAFDCAISLLYFFRVFEPPSYYASSIWVFEDSGRTIQFDPVRGYTLTTTPSRWARFTKGTLEFVGILKGNNQGFPDNDDFHPQRRNAIEKRFAVFGDSFTAGQYFETNWPDRLEELTRSRQRPAIFLNFSVDGGGLANWWSILTKIVEAEHYELDGIIFAVYPGDLRRKLTVSDHRNQKVHVRGRVASWDPSTYPKTLEDARPAFEPNVASHIISTDEFDRFLKGEWMPPVRYEKRARLYFAWLVWTWITDRLPNRSLTRFNGFDAERQKLIADIKRSAANMGLPILVVHVPSRIELTNGQFDKDLPAETKAFAHELGAMYVDGKEAFLKCDSEEIKSMWLPYDAHWGQKGSDRFALFMDDIVRKWQLSTPEVFGFGAL